MIQLVPEYGGIVKVLNEWNLGHTNIRHDPSEAAQSLAWEVKGPGVNLPAISASLQGTRAGDSIP